MQSAFDSVALSFGDVVDAVGVADSAEDPLPTSCAGVQGVDLDLHLE